MKVGELKVYGHTDVFEELKKHNKIGKEYFDVQSIKDGRRGKIKGTDVVFHTNNNLPSPYMEGSK